MNERGQSSTLGTVFVIAITVAAATATVGAAVYTLDESRTQANEERAGIAAAQFDSAAALVAFGETGQATTVGIGNADSITVSDGGSISVIATADDGTTQTLVDEPLGAVEYATDGDTLAYQGGGVWRQGDGYARMVSPPEFDFNDDTLTIPVVSVTAADLPARFSGDTVRLASGGSETTYPSPESGVNPVEDRELTVRVQSDYYRAWGRYFERWVGGDVTVDDSTETASVTLTTEYDNSIFYGAAATGTSGFNLKGGGGSPTFLDSYDSTEGPYSESQRDDGRIVATSNVNLGGGVTVYGDVIVPEGNYVNVNGNAEIRNGEVIKQPVEVQRPGGRVTQRVASARDDNNNSNVAALADNSLAGDGDVTLSAGTYYIDGELQLDGHTLTLEPSTDEEVTLAVTGNIDISNGGEIAVAGNNDNAARVYTTGGSVSMSSGEVSVLDDASPRFWLYGTDDLTATMSSQSRFVGIFYAPGDRSSLDMRSESEIFGAMAVGKPDLKSGSTIHYDLAASGMPAYDSDVTIFSYLHVSRNTVVVEES
ncbi:hypothetical protein DM867_01525 [Halosegnis rubeus]|jgi:flagellin-like protein|uniref:DUF7305 domain-containing protein n=1 Tax=Halosegnis rubeus TaxID=2212850 RepID=A0A5N5UB57_9EURY|nr:archaellin/type IV pilin N-terminal domain-containing protein [Halosegnis rubeus]KAB7515850.1 hypothetical protein DM867_01525 [Halosegnis rubeus]